MARILVVDDNAENRYMLETLLRGHGHEVDLAGNGSAALEIARTRPPDIVVTDILMPEMDGFTLCSRWKADQQLSQKPLVFYTATYTDPLDEQLAVDLGADRFIAKPTEPAQLVEALEEMLEEEAREHHPPRLPQAEAQVLQKQYNNVVLNKLEQKVSELGEANEALLRSEALLRTITNQIPHAMLVVGRENDSIEYFNDQFLKLWKIEHLAIAMVRKEIPAGDVVAGCLPQIEDGAEFLAAFRAFQADEFQAVLDDEVQLVDGRCLRRFCGRIRDEHGEPVGCLYMFEDITERKQNEEQALERAAASAKLGALSDREREVLDLLVTGKPNKAIAAQLGISERTVERHRSNMMHKLRINNVPELVRLRLLSSA